MRLIVLRVYYIGMADECIGARFEFFFLLCGECFKLVMDACQSRR